MEICNRLAIQNRRKSKPMLNNKYNAQRGCLIGRSRRRRLRHWSRRWRRCGLWRCRSPFQPANWSQVMAPRTTASLVENHAVGCFLQRTKLWHGCAAPCPWTATICYPQRCNCLAAFAFRFDLKPCRTSICTEVQLLILGCTIGWRSWSRSRGRP